MNSAKESPFWVATKYPVKVVCILPRMRIEEGDEDGDDDQLGRRVERNHKLSYPAQPQQQQHPSIAVHLMHIAQMCIYRKTPIGAL